MKEREAQNLGATMYTHWMKISAGEREDNSQANNRARKKSYDRRATPHPDIERYDMVMLNAKKIKSKRPTRKFTP